MKTTFTTDIRAVGNNTGIEVPPENIAALGVGKRPAVKVMLPDHTYASTVAVMGGKFMIALSRANRDAAGLKAGDSVEVTLELDQEPRTVAVPSDLQKALDTAGVTARFNALAPSKRKAFVQQLEDAKTEETRTRRVTKVVASFSE